MFTLLGISKSKRVIKRNRHYLNNYLCSCFSSTTSHLPNPASSTYQKSNDKDNPKKETLNLATPSPSPIPSPPHLKTNDKDNSKQDALNIATPPLPSPPSPTYQQSNDKDNPKKETLNLATPSPSSIPLYSPHQKSNDKVSSGIPSPTSSLPNPPSSPHQKSQNKDNPNKQKLTSEFSSTTPPQKAILNNKDNPKKEMISFDLKEAVSNLQRILYIEDLEDWYQISKSYILSFGGKVLAKKYPTVESLVTAAYPEHAWDSRRFAHNYAGRALYTPQTFMARIVRSVFPRETQELNARAGHGIIGASGRHLEIDVYIPNLKLGFEYQDPHHYFHTSYGQHALSDYQAKDKHKQLKAEELGITLINVPFWWNWDKESLIATIIQKRPDLAYISDSGVLPSPLTDDPPPHIIAKFTNEVPGLGTPMLAIHAPNSRTFDPTEWWVMEKYDGVRAVWNSSLRTMFSRWGKVISLPHFIYDSLPSCIWLDAEIWFGRKKGTRYQAIGLTRIYKASGVDWNSFHLMVFDTPDPKLRDLPYKERYSRLLSTFPQDSVFATMSPYFVPPSESLAVARQFIEDMFFKIRAQGGEGIILRNPDSTYEHGYSENYYKHKGFLDAEALIIEKKGDNKFIGKVSKDHLFRNMLNSMPSRREMNEEGIAEEEEEGEEGEAEIDKNRREGEKEEGEAEVDVEVEKKSIGELLDKIESTGGETEEEVGGPEQIGGRERRGGENDRGGKGEAEKAEKAEISGGGKKGDGDGGFFEVELSVDEELFDGSIEEITKGMFVSFRYAGQLQKFGPPRNPKIYALRTDINNWSQLLHSKSVPPEHQTVWAPPVGTNYAVREQRRQFFDSYAKSNGFDPLVPDNWYTVSQGNLLSTQGGRATLHYYNYSPSRALLDLYPDIGLQVHKFIYKPKRYWTSQENRRRFFTDLARARGFSIEKTTSWYTLPLLAINKQPGGSGILQYYKNDFPAAICETFPELNLDKSKFVSRTGTKYKRFFDSFALENNFDPLVPSNWYNVKKSKITNIKEAKSMLYQYKNSVENALIATYPDIGLTKTGWKAIRDNHKQVLARLATSLGYDPYNPESWYKLQRNDIYAFKGINELLSNYDNSLGTALLSCFPDIGLNKSKFNPVTHKAFLDAFAAKRGFDPLSRDNWELVTSADIRKEKGGLEILRQYGNSIIDAVLDAYPFIKSAKT